MLDGNKVRGDKTRKKSMREKNSLCELQISNVVTLSQWRETRRHLPDIVNFGIKFMDQARHRNREICKDLEWKRLAALSLWNHGMLVSRRGRTFPLEDAMKI